MGRNKRNNPQKSLEEVTLDIQERIFSILRRMDRLHGPLTEFDPTADGRYRISRASKQVIHDETCELAGNVWHLKDRLRMWLRRSELAVQPTVEEIAESYLPLKLCADLFNAFKHGDSDDRSGYRPKLNGLSLKIPGSVGLRYDGAIQEGEFVLPSPTPTEYSVEIISGDNKFTFGEAREVIHDAFDQWRIVLINVGFLGNDVRSNRIREMFTRFENKIHPFFVSPLLSQLRP